jgi:hypothetical protein
MAFSTSAISGVEWISITPKDHCHHDGALAG